MHNENAETGHSTGGCYPSDAFGPTVLFIFVIYYLSPEQVCPVQVSLNMPQRYGTWHLSSTHN